MAFRSLTDDSRSLALANRYEARLQRLYDRAYKTLRELQQVRKAQPTPPHAIHIRWFDPNEDSDQPTGQHPTSDTQPQSYNPSVSAGVGTEPKAEPNPPETELRNKPTDATNKEVAPQPFEPESLSTVPQFPDDTRGPISDVEADHPAPRNPKSDISW